MLQSFGITMGSITWREVIVKLLNHDGHMPLQKRINYVGQRIKWFFMEQKRPIIAFMLGLQGSPDEKLFSHLYQTHARLIEENQTIRSLVFDAYDAAVERQLQQWLALFKSTMSATFSNPWVFLKKTGGRMQESDIEEEFLIPTIDDTKARIPTELQNRTGIERTLTSWISDIPTEPHKLDDAVDNVQLLVLKVYAIIRSQICDQVELFSESFFKLPLMRKLEEDMSRIELSEVDKETYRIRRTSLEEQDSGNSRSLKEVGECIQILDDFRRSVMGGF